ncbi:hypothetical protein BD289DRAFT_185725 [Coniella lustricola]|uniref:Uncharacterized protein n=1 Tax=Coniella lustricola TaxID=2025994 RepID=A0A2T2ZT23_9PEZI|nr:hypothetical protein BD289DRAFT_185725 [Coniella lustricola]
MMSGWVDRPSRTTVRSKCSSSAFCSRWCLAWRAFFHDGIMLDEQCLLLLLPPSFLANCTGANPSYAHIQAKCIAVKCYMSSLGDMMVSTHAFHRLNMLKTKNTRQSLLSRGKRSSPQTAPCSRPIDEARDLNLSLATSPAASFERKPCSFASSI